MPPSGSPRPTLYEWEPCRIEERSIADRLLELNRQWVPAWAAYVACVDRRCGDQDVDGVLTVERGCLGHDLLRRRTPAPPQLDLGIERSTAARRRPDETPWRSLGASALITLLRAV